MTTIVAYYQAGNSQSFDPSFFIGTRSIAVLLDISISISSRPEVVNV
jgi:hypothetical protein